MAYFTPGKPMPGSADITYEWDGARWQFADTAHRELFESDPDAYAPQYGGYCMLGMVTGNRGEINPEVWAIVDGKLYLTYDQESLTSGGRTRPPTSRRPTRTGPSCRTEARRRSGTAAPPPPTDGRQPFSFFAIPATCLPWKRAMPFSCSDGCRSPWPPAMVVAP